MMLWLFIRKISYATGNGRYEGVGWEGNIGFCKISIGEVYVSDFNGDGSQDLMCFQKYTGYVPYIVLTSFSKSNALRKIIRLLPILNRKGNTTYCVLLGNSHQDFFARNFLDKCRIYLVFVFYQTLKSFDLDVFKKGDECQ